MAVIKKSKFEIEKECMDILKGLKYEFNEKFYISFIRHDQYLKVVDSLTTLRRERIIDGTETRILVDIFIHYYRNFYKIKDLEGAEPRKAAQRFIGKRKIREFIFKRDGYRCLKCSTKENLSIDHIVAVSKSGENKLSNLQTLCKSCNSTKSDNYKDYR